MNILKEIKEGKKQFYLREFKEMEDIKEIEKIESAISINQEITLTAKSMGTAYILTFIKTKEGFKITYFSRIYGLTGQVYKTLKDLIRGIPPPSKGYREDLSWMNR